MIRALRDRHRRMIPWVALVTALLVGWALGSAPALRSSGRAALKDSLGPEPPSHAP